ncbi:Kinase, NEK [Giardia duodenalis]|uniref:non-specific serine/threonine protein kinase n=1 Tax=Giardia intestinalis (strain ATCC 50803 / WB clone C6) TaxID=184922 RepID=A8BG66_GIAIC|nr:Kinase, NEK [Giardia intestinalis]KAE8302219.1 Kinase, NEK [Giardia intestinalis]|eukprot:XP_001707136.1 Kinase, NEK [Giardia lamblia ATCC 50803]
MAKLPDRYFEIGKIATGGFATIYRAVDLETGLVVALKDTIYNCSSRSATKAMRREIAILRNIQHCNIVRCYDIQRATEESRYFISMELCNCDLHDFIRAFRHKRRRIPEATVLTMIKDIASALAFLHNPINFTTIDSLDADEDSIRVIIHRDVKPGNIMLANDGFFKLCDFNLAREINTVTGAMSNTGTIAYMAPELLDGKKYDEKVDLWSLGCTIHEMCMYYSPFHNQSITQALNNIMMGRYDSICNFYSERLRKLVQMLLSINPLDRPSAAELLGHPLLADIRKNLGEPSQARSDDDRMGRLVKRAGPSNKSTDSEHRQPFPRQSAPEHEKPLTPTRSPYMKQLTQVSNGKAAQLLNLEKKVERTQTPGRVFKQLKYPIIIPDKHIDEPRIEDTPTVRAKTPSEGNQEREQEDTKQPQHIPYTPTYKLGSETQHVQSYPTLQHTSNSPRRQGVISAGSTGVTKVSAQQYGQVGAPDLHHPQLQVEDRGQHQHTLLASSAGRRLSEHALKRSQSNLQTKPEALQSPVETALIVAATQNNKKGVTLNLKQAGSYNSAGMTALHIAAHNNYYSIIPLLLEKEGRMTMIRAYKYRGVRYQGLTALHIAAINGYVESVSVLATTEAKQQDALNSQTALMLCAIHNHIECARILIAYERACRDANGMTALIHAIDSENIEHVRLLAHLENTVEDTNGRTPLTYAVAKGNTDIIRVLLPLHNKSDVSKSIDTVRQAKLLSDRKLDEIERYMRKYV